MAPSYTGGTGRRQRGTSDGAGQTAGTLALKKWSGPPHLTASPRPRRTPDVAPSYTGGTGRHHRGTSDGQRRGKRRAALVANAWDASNRFTGLFDLRSFTNPQPSAMVDGKSPAPLPGYEAPRGCQHTRQTLRRASGSQSRGSAPTRELLAHRPCRAVGPDRPSRHCQYPHLSQQPIMRSGSPALSQRQGRVGGETHPIKGRSASP